MAAWPVPIVVDVFAHGLFEVLVSQPQCFMSSYPRASSRCVLINTDKTSGRGAGGVGDSIVGVRSTANFVGL